MENKNYLLIKKLKYILGFIPYNVKLLTEAFIYNFSFTNKIKDYSIKFHRLEFLGDSILNAIVSNFLFKKFPLEKEGKLTYIRSQIVCRNNLNNIAKKLNIEEIFPDKKIIHNNGVLGNTLEALIGFIYLEKMGYKKCEYFITNEILEKHVDMNIIRNQIFSYKVWIMEWCQKSKFNAKFTFLTKKNNKNEINYLSKLHLLDCDIKTYGLGSSKKKSEEIASRKAYFKIKQNEKVKKI